MVLEFESFRDADDNVVNPFVDDDWEDIDGGLSIGSDGSVVSVDTSMPNPFLDDEEDEEGFGESSFDGFGSAGVNNNNDYTVSDTAVNPFVNDDDEEFFDNADTTEFAENSVVEGFENSGSSISFGNVSESVDNAVESSVSVESGGVFDFGGSEDEGVNAAADLNVVSGVDRGFGGSVDSTEKSAVFGGGENISTGEDNDSGEGVLASGDLSLIHI